MAPTTLTAVSHRGLQNAPRKEGRMLVFRPVLIVPKACQELIDEVEQSAESKQLGAKVCAVAGGGLLVSAAVVHLVDRHRRRQP